MFEMFKKIINGFFLKFKKAYFIGGKAYKLIVLCDLKDTKVGYLLKK